MGQALVRGWLARGRAPASIFVADTLTAACDLAQAAGLKLVADLNAEDGADIVVLAVKPQQVTEALGEHRHLMESGVTVLSIVAGKKIAQLVDDLGGGASVVRAMPNTPAAISEGMTVLCANEFVSPRRRAQCEELMRAVGAVEWIDDEALMDVVTALSGSGPAYVFLLIECLAAAGAELGLAPELAMRLALQTVAGSGDYARESSRSPAELRRGVTSPGGTTEAALEVLMADDGMGRLMSAAVRAAAERGKALSET